MEGQDSQVSGETRLTFITEGIFVRLLRDNPTLKGVGAVVLDEFHERNIHTDIALALVRKLQQTRRLDLKLVVMSATLDTTTLEKYLEDAAVFDVEGRAYPVEVEYISGRISDGYKEKKMGGEDCFGSKTVAEGPPLSWKYPGLSYRDRRDHAGEAGAGKRNPGKGSIDFAFGGRPAAARAAAGVPGRRTTQNCTLHQCGRNLSHHPRGDRGY